MNSDLQIDEALRHLNAVQPPLGLEARIQAELRRARSRTRRVWIQSSALAASAALACIALRPVPQHGTTVAPAPHITLHAPGSFGSASAVHLPSAPVAALPRTVRGRGHARARTGRAVLPDRTQVPRGVAVPSPLLSPTPETAPLPQHP